MKQKQAIYLDNAATTALDSRVLEAMLPYLQMHYGNPSSTHSHGREARSAIEIARKRVAELLNTSPSEIFFTSGGTEADNFALRSSIETLGIKQVISSPLEHHAVLHTLQHLEKLGQIELHLLQVDDKGLFEMSALEALLQKYPKALVSLMHGNNEIGNLNDLHKIGELAKQYGAIFHSDTVQTMGHYAHDLQALPVDFIVGAAHKFHGPKGVGFLYVNANNKIHPLLHGGAQERNMRGGTENIYGIVGLAKALELAYEEMTAHRQHIESLKKHMIEGLKSNFPDISFNGLSGEIDQSLYTVLNANFPPSDKSDMLLFSLDIEGVSVSGGSACSSGSNIGSHVLHAIGAQAPGRASVRFSFGRFNTKEEVNQTLEVLKQTLSPIETP